MHTAFAIENPLCVKQYDRHFVTILCIMRKYIRPHPNASRLWLSSTTWFKSNQFTTIFTLSQPICYIVAFVLETRKENKQMAIRTYVFMRLSVSGEKGKNFNRNFTELDDVITLFTALLFIASDAVESTTLLLRQRAMKRVRQKQMLLENYNDALHI